MSLGQNSGENSACGGRCVVRDDAQNTTNPAISVVVYHIIPLLIGQAVWILIISIMYHVGEGTWPCLFPVTANWHGRVTEPKSDHLSGCNLRTIPENIFLWIFGFCYPCQFSSFSVTPLHCSEHFFRVQPSHLFFHSTSAMKHMPPFF